MTQKTHVKIGTRGSPLALVQTETVRKALQDAHPHLREDGAVEIVKITTTGDKIRDRALSDAGGKGLFTKEIEEALADGGIDMAVHSMKDMPTVYPDGMDIPCMLKREDPRDAFFSPKAKTLMELPEGAVIGTASLRRQAIALFHRPDLKAELLRGNVETRLRKLKEGLFDATFLALAGINRLGYADKVTSVLEPDIMLPAVGQGAVGIEIRSDDAAAQELLAAIHDDTTGLRVAAERAFLAVLDGSCRTPIAALAEPADGGLRFRALIARPDGGGMVETERFGSETDAEAMGRDAAAELRGRAGPEYFSD